MKICIIGGTGLLGSQSAAELISRGHQVSNGESNKTRFSFAILPKYCVKKPR